MAAGIASALILGAIAIPLTHKAAPPAVQAADPQSTRLDLRAGECGVRYGSNPVKFAPTDIAPEARVDSTSLCRIAREAVDRETVSAQRFLNDLCDSVRPKLAYTFGVDGFAQAAARMRETGSDSDSSTSALYAIVVRCIDPATSINVALSAIHMRIYSVGTLRVNGRFCLGYLEETTNSPSTGVLMGYDLRGTGSCKGQEFHAPDGFHPERNPSGRKPGDIMRSEFAYTGPLPTQWTYKGTAYAFASDAPSRAEPPTKDSAVAPTVAATPAESPDTSEVAAPALMASEPRATAGAQPEGSAAAESASSLAALSVQQLQSLGEKGSAPAWAELGTRYLKGAGVEQNLDRAAFWFQKAAERGEPRAQTNLGWLYATGKGIARDDRAAIDLFTKAAAKAYPNAEDSLGWMYEKGRGVPQDRGIAISWYRKAAAQGFEKSRQNLARLEAGHG